VWNLLGLGGDHAAHGPTPKPALPDRQLEEARDLTEVRRQVRKLWGNSAVRQAAEATLADPFALVRDFEPVLHALTNPRGYYGWRETLVAAWVLGNARLTDVQRRLAVRTLSDVAEHGMRFTVVGGLAQSTKRAALIGLSAVLTFALSRVTSAPVILHDHTGSVRVREAAVRALGSMAAVEALEVVSGALFDSLPGAIIDEGRVGKAAMKAMLGTLPYISAEWYGHISPRTMHNLIRALKHPDDTLVLEVVRALGRAGDGSAAKRVAMLAESSQSEEIKEAAAEALPALLERERKEHLAGSLLRPVDGQHSEKHDLLRPAHDCRTGDTSQLLRAAEDRKL
jgi:hypothetical protein